MKRAYRIAVTGLVLSTLTGCLGGRALINPPLPPAGGVRYAAADADGFICPYGNNVIPDYDTNLDGTEFYRVCYHETDETRIRVTGSTVDSPSICIYPVEVVDAENVFVKPDLSTGGVLKKCVSASSSDGFYSKTYYDFKKKEVKFANTRYNAVFIIEARDQAQMEFCMDDIFDGGPNRHFCPDFSWGMFRD